MRTGLVTVIFLALLLVGCVVYPGIGARFIAPHTVLQAFLHFEKTLQGRGFVNTEMHSTCSVAYQLCKPVATGPFHASLW